MNKFQAVLTRRIEQTQTGRQADQKPPGPERRREGRACEHVRFGAARGAPESIRISCRRRLGTHAYTRDAPQREDEVMMHSCDVLVSGSGIAGVIAAIEAGRAGARVVLASKGRLFSGSSFFPGTWGLGLIAPANADDGHDLMRTILDVGCGVADPALVETLVDGLLPAID